MKHGVSTKKLGRSSNHRKALIRNLLRSLFLYGEITVSEARAKQVKRWADKLIFQAKQNTIQSKRELHKFFGKRDIVNALVEKIAPAMSDRDSGFVSIKEVGARRGDNTKLFRVELVNKPANLGSFSPEKSEKEEGKKE
jgi:large subunit ribosomal protein L17